MGLLASASAAAIARLIANTDMHLGNLTFHVEGTFRLAPAYDMLPMAYAPLPGGEVAKWQCALSIPHCHSQASGTSGTRRAAPP